MAMSKSKAKEVFSVLSEENRLRMISLLSKKSLSCSEAEKYNLPKYSCVIGELAKKCDLSMATASHHLKQLKNAGLVGMKKKGKNQYCWINQKKFDEVVNFLSSFSSSD
ncbi:MAG: ArsR/SmtB family transcription factor [Candidatus Pacearchaeota archaeon]